MIDQYDWAGGCEAMIRFGSGTGPVVVLALPLWEEANRTRTFAVRLLRLLAERGIAGALPDLPGQGESAIDSEYAMLAGWRTAFAAVGVLGLISLACMVVVMPKMAPQRTLTFADLPRVLRTHRAVRTGIAMTFLAITGHFTA